MEGWLDFKKNPPHSCHDHPTMECDPDRGFILYRYTKRGDDWMVGRNWTFVSTTPYNFDDGAFTGYRSHMVTSPYPEDHIEVLAWLPYDDATTLLMKSANDWLRTEAISGC